MAVRKSERDLTMKTLRLYTDQLKDIADLFPGQPFNRVLRALVDASLMKIKNRRNQIEQGAIDNE